MLNDLPESIHRLTLGAADRLAALAPKKHAAFFYSLLIVLLMGLALLARLLIAPIDAGLQYLTFFPAVTLAAILGGYRAGLLATLIGLVLATTIFTPPHFAISIEVLQTSFWSNMVFLIEGIIVSFSIEALHLYRQKYQQELNESRELQINTAKLNEQLSKQITERKLTENKLRMERNLNQGYLDTTQALMVELGSDGNITMINRAAENLLGYAKNELLGRNWFTTCLPQPEGSDTILPVFHRLMAGDIQSLGEYENFILCQDGQQHVIAWRNTLRTDSAGRAIGTLSSGLDITERKKVELAVAESLHQLEEKELSKGRFFAAAGHDLRQPLAAANLFIDALKFAEMTPRQSKIIQNLDLAMTTFQGLLDSLLNISKLDSGAIKPEFSTINIVEVFGWLERNFVPMAREKQIGFRLYFPMRETLAVLSDIGLLNSVLTNLVSNAIKFTSKGAILVSARKRGSEVLFQVWDTGMGISDENIKKIFTEFYQANNPQRDRTGGLGLGLAIAERAATLLGSKISCHSRLGRGSVFEFRLPLDGTASDEVQRAAAKVPQKEAVNLAFMQGKRFVVVEDDLLLAQALTQSLEGLGGEVEGFHSAEEALLYANSGYADCYIVDYMLGGTLNGIELLNLLQKKSGKPIKAVLMTGDTSSALIQKTVHFNWPVLFKPANMTKLISSLEAQEDNQV